MLTTAEGGIAPMTLAEILDLIAQDCGRHMTTEPASELELDSLEESLGSRLPIALRALLSRLGGGILYERHEIFGARRLMIHDIELVPDLASFRARLAQGGSLPDGLVPFHRADGIVHFLDLRKADSPVVSLDAARSYSDLACFLERVVLAERAPRGRVSFCRSGS